MAELGSIASPRLLNMDPENRSMSGDTSSGSIFPA
jgi:hypothetical protein